MGSIILDLLADSLPGEWSSNFFVYSIYSIVSMSSCLRLSLLIKGKP